MSNKTNNRTLVKHDDYQEEEVHYEDPESPVKDPQVSVTSTVTDLDRAEVQTTHVGEVTENNLIKGCSVPATTFRIIRKRHR